MAKYTAEDVKKLRSNLKTSTQNIQTAKVGYTADDVRKLRQEQYTKKALQIQKEQALKEKNEAVEPPKLALNLNEIMDYAGFNKNNKNNLDEIFEKQSFEYQKNLPFAINATSKKQENFVGKIPAPVSAAAGFADTATMGLIEATANRRTQGLPDIGNKNEIMANFLNAAKVENPKAYTAGQIAGYVAPGSAIDKAAGTVLKGATKVLPRIAQRAIIGGTSGAVQEATEGLIRGESAEDIVKRTVTGGVVGGVADPVLDLVGRGLKKSDIPSTPKVSDLEPLKAKTLPQKYAVKGSKTEQTFRNALNDNLTDIKSDKTNLQPIYKDEPIKVNKSVTEDIGLKKNNTVETLTFKPGEGFADNVITPSKQKAKVDNERGFSYNVRTDKAMNEDIRKAFDENPLTYEPLTNKETLAKAESRITGDFTQDYRSWTENLDKFDPSDIPLARQLANTAAKNGDLATARKIIADVSEKLTQAGQYSQAAAILRKSDPATFNTFIENQFRKLNEQGRQMYGKKWTDLSLTDAEMKQLYSKEVVSEEEREKLMESIYNRISQSMPSSNMEKFDAWRRIAMLLNPKTHIRNVVGNGIMAVLRKSADTIGAGLEKVFLKQGDRTKSFGWSVDKDLVKTVDNVWKQEAKNLTATNRYDINNIRFMNRDKRIFKNKGLNALDQFVKWSLTQEDKIFLERAYKDALGGYMKANGLKEATQAAKDYAQRRAFEATFKQANWLSDVINKAKNKKGIGKFVEGAIPFTQTPANIMMRGVEYSPLGIMKALYGANSKAGAQIIEDMAKGLTGTTAMAAGYVLASMGAAKWQRSKSDTAASLEANAGEQSGSIMTPWGSYTFDWAQPAAIPLAMGISFYEGLQKKDASTAEALLNAITSGGDTIVNMTMLKNIKDILGSGGSPTAKILGVPVSYVEQAIPSLFGQIAKATDTTKRSTYDPNPAKAEIKKIQSKIPGLSKSLPADRDIFGQTQDTGGWFQQFVSPGYWKDKTDDPVTKELVRLYKANKETDFLPKYLKGSFSVNGTEYVLSAEELEQMRKEVGQTTLQRMKELINTPNYKLSSDENKMKLLRSVVNGVYNQYKNEYAKLKSKK